MTRTLFDGGCVDGDNALCEAALSTRCFYWLCEAGVPFPCNGYGEFVGYKTDHDPYARATSAGPLTSRFMTEALERRATGMEIPVYDGLLAVEVLKDEAGVTGLLCLDLQTQEYRLLPCAHLVLATGGPAGIYRDTVYPQSQNGSTGLALDAGVSLQNMTEWQYGLASVNPRWNVSGTYMQVLPRFVSVDADGTEREFLAEAFPDPCQALSLVFLKGYQWPFDIRKAQSGSSVIDLLVYRETVLRERKVYLDFTKNPFGLEQIPFDQLSEEAYAYLQVAGACFGTPIQRLEKMNSPAIDLYRSKGVDLTCEPLQIALSAQHNNGGIAVDCWWQTSLPGLYAVGECAGTHGIARPGGSALNAGQVGAFRAAQHIGASDRKARTPDSAAIPKWHERLWDFDDSNAASALEAARSCMSAWGGPVRNIAQIRSYCAQLQDSIVVFPYRVSTPMELVTLYRLRDTLLVQHSVLSAMADYFHKVGASRGSALYTDENGSAPAGMEGLFRFTVAKPDTTEDRIQQITPSGILWRPVRPIPEEDTVFETVWRNYRNQSYFRKVDG